jgi:catechol 2,3-dioxygenase-like lactoylglutathione lyase family enzyme
MSDRIAITCPLKRIIIFVGDVQKCAGFYRDAFGFAPLQSDHPSTDWLELDTGGCLLAFHKAHGPNGPIDAPTGSATNPHKIVFYVEDVAAAREDLVRRGISIGPVHAFGKLCLCDGQDPEGHVFQLSNR